MLRGSAAVDDDPRPSDGATPESSTRPSALRDGAARSPLWRRLLPFVIAVALVAFVLARLDLRTFVSHLSHVHYAGYFAFTFTFLFALLAADTFATVLVYRRLVAPVRFREFFVLRGASYLPSMLNHHIGQAFITLFLSRVYRI